MIKLTERLKSIAEEVNMKTMVDVGTDHGFLPIYLWENKICHHVILSDVSKGSLDKAIENCHHYYPHEKFDCRLGDGLTVVSPEEAEVVVMAGIGGPLIANILQQDLEKSKKFKRFILQPRRHVEYLRQWLDENKFQVVKEKLVRERGMICEIFVVEYNPNYVPFNYSQPVLYEFPDSLLDTFGPLTMDYFDFWLTKAKRNLANASKGNNQNDITRWSNTIKRLEELIERGESIET